MKACPSRDDLACFLAERMAPAQAQTLEAHVENCSNCQQQLDQLSQQSNSGLVLLPRTSTTAFAPAHEFLDRLKHQAPPRDEPCDTPPGISVVPLQVELPSVPGYEILAELGRGGMGVVFKARHLGLNRLVALKMLLSVRFATHESRQRFHLEAQAIARLQHPNIVQIYDVGDTAAGPYLSLELLETGSLARRMDGKPQPPLESARIVERLARAVHYAHEQGVIHRDLKPSNILLKDESGRLKEEDRSHSSVVLHPSLVPKITDFGLAKRFTNEDGSPTPDATQTGNVIGTPSYMAPEQASGQSKLVGPAADVYALGAILYEMLAGRPPFRGATILDTLVEVRNQDPIPPRRLQPAVARDLETICLKCLQKEPRNRYATAADVAEDLRRFQAGQPILAQPVGAVERLWRWARRRPAVASLAASLLLITVLGFAGLTWAWQHADQGWRHAEIALKGETDARRDLAKQKIRAENALYIQKLALAHHEWLGFNVRRANALLEECPTEQRSFEWRYLKRLCNAEAVCLPEHKLPIWGVAFSPDGRRLATTTGEWTSAKPSEAAQGEVQIWDADTGKKRFTCLGHIGAVLAVAFSPDGRLLATAGFDGTARVWDADTGEQRFVIDFAKARVHCVAFSPDSQRLAIGGGGFLKVWHTETQTELLSLVGHSQRIQGVAFTPDGQRLVSGGRDYLLHVWDVSDDKRGKITTPIHRINTGGDVRCLAVSSNGQLFASGDYSGLVKVFALATGKEIVTQQGHQGSHVQGLTFSPDGWTIASSDFEGRILLWEAKSGGRMRIIRGHAGMVLGLAFRPDGQRLASGGGDGAAKIWDITAEQSERKLGVKARFLHNFAFSPDSQWVALAGGINSAGQENLVKLWNVGTGQMAPPWKGHAAGVSAVAISPDGKHLASASADKTVILWRMPTGEKVQTLKAHASAVNTVAYSPDGKWLASGSADGKICIWRAAEASAPGAVPLRTIAEHSDAIRGLVFSPNSRWLISGSKDQSVRLWDVEDGRQALLLLSLPGPVGSLAVSADGRHLAVACHDEDIRVWELTVDPEGRVSTPEYRSFRGHTGGVHAVAFSHDSRRLASGSLDATLRVWDVDSGQETLALRGPVDVVSSVAFSPDGRALAAGSQVITLYEAASPLLDAAALEQRSADWHQREALDARINSEWHAALFHLTQLESLRPKAPNLHAGRGDIKMYLGQWDDATIDFAAAIALNPENVDAWFRHGAALLVAGKHEAFCAVRAQALKRFSQTRNWYAAYTIARMATLAPVAADDLPLLAPLAEQVLSFAKDSPYVLHTRAMAHLRADRYELAIKTAQQSINSKESWDAHVVNHLLLALAYNKLNQAKDGRRHYDIAVAWIEKAQALPVSQDPQRFGVHIHDWLTCLNLRREAEALLEVERLSVDRLVGVYRFRPVSGCNPARTGTREMRSANDL